MTMITPSYLGETIEYSSLHACRSTLEDPTSIPMKQSLLCQPQGLPAGSRLSRIRPHSTGTFAQVWGIRVTEQYPTPAGFVSPGR